jgi:hypothetical protein
MGSTERRWPRSMPTFSGGFPICAVACRAMHCCTQSALYETHGSPRFERYGKNLPKDAASPDCGSALPPQPVRRPSVSKRR